MARRSMFVFVGDLSADRYVAGIIRKLKEADPELEVWGVGGPHMKETGMEQLHNCQELAVIGPIETLKLYPKFKRIMDQCVEGVRDRKPDLALLVDFGGFNIKLMQRLRDGTPSLPIYYFISPQVWASRQGRIKKIGLAVTKMLVIFPFEETLYRKNGVNAQFVGHPLTTMMPELTDLPSREDFCNAHGLDPARPIVTVFSGSRIGEIKNLAPVLMKAIRWISDERPEIQFVISQANERIAESVNRCIAQSGLAKRVGKDIIVVGASENNAAVKASDIVWAKSGTTTLEVALLARPMLVFYRGLWISYALFRAYVRIKRIAWPNLLAGGELVPELVQLDCRAEQLVKYTRDFLDVPILRQKISQRLTELREQLGHGDYVSNVSNELLAVLQNSPEHAETA